MSFRKKTGYEWGWRDHEKYDTTRRYIEILSKYEKKLLKDFKEERYEKATFNRFIETRNPQTKKAIQLGEEKAPHPTEKYWIFD